jgi:hypothetical protein
MSLLDFFRKKLLGEANVMQPSGFEPGVNTQGLFGQGGDFGGGLFQNNFSQMNQGEGGLLGNIPQAALLGSALYGQGIQGKDPFSALLPAVSQTAQIQKMLTPQREKLMTAYDPKTKKNVFATRTQIEEKGLEPSPKSPELTADQRNFSAFKNIMETGTESEKDIAKQIFTSGGKNVRPKEDFLIRISEQLAKDITKSPEEIQSSLPKYADIYDKIIGAVDSSSASQFEIKAPQGFNGTDQEWKILKDANPNLPNEEIIKNWNKYKKG